MKPLSDLAPGNFSYSTLGSQYTDLISRCGSVFDGELLLAVLAGAINARSSVVDSTKALNAIHDAIAESQKLRLESRTMRAELQKILECSRHALIGVHSKEITK
jgi:hypothetical protein